jgi:5'-AMP-activated protein kinase regulatory gamma subunit
MSGSEVVDPNGMDIPTQTFAHDKTVLRQTGKQAIHSFLKDNTCFTVLRISGKVVVFDTRIPIQLAFYALVEHDMLAAPLWDPTVREFVGMLTVADFIDILRYYRKARLNVSHLSQRSISDILEDPNTSKLLKQGNEFLGADATASLYNACELLLSNRVDFLPILLPDDMRVLSTLTYTHVLEHLVNNFREQRRLFDDSIYDLGIGTYTNVVTVQPHQTLAECLHLMDTNGLSAVPVVDANGAVVDVYSRSDITFLAKATDAQDAIRNLDLSLGDILSQQRHDVTTPDRLHTCRPDHTLQSIFEYFAQLKFNRLIVTNEQQCVVGVVSARDLVAYFVNNAGALADDSEIDGDSSAVDETELQ